MRVRDPDCAVIVHLSEQTKVRCASENIGLANTIREPTRLTCASGLMLQQHEVWLSAVGVAPSNTWEKRTSGCSRKRNKELRIEKIRGTVNPADLMTKHLDGKRLTMCDLWSIKHTCGRPSSAPKLTLGMRISHVHHELWRQCYSCAGRQPLR